MAEAIEISRDQKKDLDNRKKHTSCTIAAFQHYKFPSSSTEAKDSPPCQEHDQPIDSILGPREPGEGDGITRPPNVPSTPSRRGSAVPNSPDLSPPENSVSASERSQASTNTSSQIPGDSHKIQEPDASEAAELPSELADPPSRTDSPLPDITESQQTQSRTPVGPEGGEDIQAASRTSRRASDESQRSVLQAPSEELQSPDEKRNMSKEEEPASPEGHREPPPQEADTSDGEDGQKSRRSSCGPAGSNMDNDQGPPDRGRDQDQEQHRDLEAASKSPKKPNRFKKCFSKHIMPRRCSAFALGLGVGVVLALIFFAASNSISRANDEDDEERVRSSVATVLMNLGFINQNGTQSS
ncbi:hypothetical protein MKZ38_006912 [Zalerion maritima]|uniref:Uncharacterized protein n=1 Tax=Zalerion maritima TaxID=339359 RepID=A0AAD5RV90_9PEZI|nr:hypothetical protein MKZ38_006912 [Zalerion maritima]